MGKVIGAIVLIWLGFVLLSWVARVISAIVQQLKPVGQQAVSGVGAFATAVPVMLSRIRHGGPSMFFGLFDPLPIGLVLIGGVFLLAVDPVVVIDSLDHAFGSSTPFMGWGVAGAVIGLALSLLARVLEETPVDGKSALARVPGIANIQAGELAARTINVGKMLAGGVAAVLVSFLIIVDSQKNSKHPGGHAEDAAATAVTPFANLPKSILHDRLDESQHVLQGPPMVAMSNRHSTALQVMRSIEEAARVSADKDIQRIGVAANLLLTRYVTDTEAQVRAGAGDAIRRAEAVTSIDRPQGLVWQAILHERGNGGAVADEVRAFDLYLEASKAGAKKADVGMELLARRMVADKRQAVRERAYSYFEGRVPLPDPWAQLSIGRRYVQGDGVPADPTKGADLLLLALIGDGEVSVRSQAFTTLVDNRSSSPMITRTLDRVAPKIAALKEPVIRKQAFAYLEIRAQEGDAGAQLWTGYRYRTGDGGVSRDTKQARSWFLKALQSTDPKIQERALAAILDLRASNQ